MGQLRVITESDIYRMQGLGDFGKVNWKKIGLVAAGVTAVAVGGGALVGAAAKVAKKKAAAAKAKALAGKLKVPAKAKAKVTAALNKGKSVATTVQSAAGKAAGIGKILPFALAGVALLAFMAFRKH